MIQWIKKIIRRAGHDKYLNIAFRDTVAKSKSECISPEEYKELMSYAKRYNIKLSQFKKFSGDIAVIKEMLDDVYRISLDFPKIVDGKKGVHICLEESHRDIFATTYVHVIEINKDLYNDTEYLMSEYNLAVAQHKFVANTNYRSIIMHEIGHVVANLYKINALTIAKEILGIESTMEVLNYVKSNLSLYSAEYTNGSEIISECFSAYYNASGNEFANKFVTRCKELIKE